MERVGERAEQHAEQGRRAKKEAFELAKLPAYKQAHQLFNQGEYKQAVPMPMLLAHTLVAAKFVALVAGS